MTEHNTFEEFYNEFKDWSKKDILKRIYDTILINNKEVERLNKNNQHMQKEMVRTWEKHDNLQARIYKAIAYLEAGKTFPSDETRETVEYMQNILLDILKGSDKDE